VLGAPVIATPCAGEQLDGAGVVVPFEDPGAIADALLALAASSRRREELARRGWTETELRKLAGENALRVLREAEQTARRLQRLREPSTATIEALDGGM